MFGLEESLADVAAMRLYRVRLTLNSTTLFSNNSGGGLDITQGRVHVAAMVTFEQNTAIVGAAMRLFGRTEVSRRQALLGAGCSTTQKKLVSLSVYEYVFTTHMHEDLH